MLKISKRKFLYSCFSIPIYLKTNNLFSKINNYDYLERGPLAGSVYYTKEKPGRWKNIVRSHIPLVEKKSNFLEVNTPHEMKGFEHFILKHIILDDKFNIISEKIFDPTKDRAYSRHDISGYGDSLFVLSICNLHDTWLEPIKM